MFWTRDSATLTPVTRPGLSLDTQRGPGASSSLLHLASLRIEDTGRYSCHSDLAAPASVRVIVASGDSQWRLCFNVAGRSAPVVLTMRDLSPYFQRLRCSCSPSLERGRHRHRRDPASCCYFA